MQNDLPKPPQESKPRYVIHILLFLITLTTTTLAGAEWMFGRPTLLSTTGIIWSDVAAGLYFSIPFLGILTVHEFGHYLTARYHKVKVTLPYYIPFIPVFPSIGTMGAVIRIKEAIHSRSQNFDVGVAGPLAGFVVALAVLFYGFTNLPEKEYIFEIHPEYQYFGLDYEQYVYDTDTSFLAADVPGDLDLQFYPDTITLFKDGPRISLGNNLTFMFFENYVVPDKSLIPNRYEMMHYPWIFAGFLALFFTALNLMPIGQLDGGHVIYGMVGPKMHKYISSTVFVGFVFYAGLGVINPHDPNQDFYDTIKWVPLYVLFLYILFRGLSKNWRDRLLVAVSVFAAQYAISFTYPGIEGYSGWLVFAFIVGRFLGINHPPALIETPIGRNRQIIGWIALIVFVISFSPRPLIVAGF